MKILRNVEKVPALRYIFKLFKMPVNIQSIYEKVDNLARLHEKVDNLHFLLTELISVYNRSNVIYVDDNMLIKRIRDYFFCIPLEDYKLLLHLLYGNPEPGLDMFIIKNLKNGAFFVDIGAHIGIVTLRAASIVGLKGKVYAFEPTPRVNKILQHNIYINNYTDIVEVFPLAISNKKGKTKLYQYNIYGHNTLFSYSNGIDEFVERYNREWMLERLGYQSAKEALHVFYTVTQKSA